MNLVLLGKPGSGKGTLSNYIESKEDVVHISTGDIFRKEIASKSELGILADSYISKGQLCPDDVTCEIIKNVLINNINKSLIFDGFPRTVNQAIALKEMLSKLNIKLDGVINLVVDDDTVISRLSSRRVCKVCGAIYNTKTHNPKVIGVCDNCGGEVITRDDDKIESIKARLNVYDVKTKPLIDYYKNENLLINLDGLKEADKLYEALKATITSSSL